MKIQRININNSDKDFLSCKLLEVIDKSIYNISKLNHKYISSLIGFDYKIKHIEKIYKIKFYFIFESPEKKPLNDNHIKKFEITDFLKKLNEILLFLEYQNIDVTTIIFSQIFYNEKDKLQFLLFEDWELDKDIVRNPLKNFILDLYNSFYKDKPYFRELEYYIQFIREGLYPISYIFLISYPYFPSLFTEFKQVDFDFDFNQVEEIIDKYNYPFLIREIYKIVQNEIKYIRIFYPNLNFKDNSYHYFKSFLLYLYFNNKLIKFNVIRIIGEFFDVEIFIDDWFDQIKSYDIDDVSCLDNFILDSTTYFFNLTKILNPIYISFTNLFHTPHKKIFFFELYTDNKVDTETDYTTRLQNLSKFGIMLKQFVEKFIFKDKLTNQDLLDLLIDEKRNYLLEKELENINFKINSRIAKLSLEKFDNIYDDPDYCKVLLEKTQLFNSDLEFDKLIVNTLKKIANSRDILGIHLKKGEIQRKCNMYVFDKSLRFLNIQYEYYEGMMITDNDFVIRTINHKTMIETKLWENNIVYFTIDEKFKKIEHTKDNSKYSNYCNCTIFHKNMYDLTLEAIEEWNEKLPIKFYLKSDENDVYYVKFLEANDDDCFSSGVGKMENDYGFQEIYYLNVCKSPIWHEMGHVIGFFHEHQRNDRDLYVKVENPFLNTQDYKLINRLNYHDMLTYDYKSIMHYKSIPRELETKQRKDIILGNNKFNELFEYKMKILSGINIDNKLCTFEIHGNSYINQKRFFCIDCMDNNWLICCEYCIKFCHTDHNYEELIGEALSFCDCGSSNHIMQCTRVSGGDQLFKQKLYVLVNSNNTYFLCFPCYNKTCKNLHKNKNFKVYKEYKGRCNCPCQEKKDTILVNNTLPIPYISLPKNHSKDEIANFEKLKKSNKKYFKKLMNKFVFNICFIGNLNDFLKFNDHLLNLDLINKFNGYSLQIIKRTDDINYLLRNKSILLLISHYDLLGSNCNAKEIVFFDKFNDLCINVISVFVLEEKNNFKSMKKLYWKEIVNGNDNNDLESTNLLKIIKILIIQPGQLIFYYQDTSSFNKISKQICDLITYNSNC